MYYQLSHESSLWIKNFVDEVYNLPINTKPCINNPSCSISFYHLSPGDCGERPGQKCYEVVRTQKVQETLRAITELHFQKDKGHSFVVCETKPTGRMHLCFRISSADLDDQTTRHLDQFDKIVPSHLCQEIRKMGRNEGFFIEISNLSTVRPLGVVRKTEDKRRTN